MISDLNIAKINSAEEIDIKSNHLSSTYLSLKKNKVKY